jgi:hypothetical protein
MAKHRPSLEAFAAGLSEVQEPEVVVTAAPHAPEPQVRKDRPHVSLYLDKAVQKTIKSIALEYDRKPHDIYLEAVNLVLARYGRPPIENIASQRIRVKTS